MSDAEWVVEHWNELAKRYAGKYVAVYKGEVIAHGDFGEVYRRVKELGVDAVIKYVFPSEIVVL